MWLNPDLGECALSNMLGNRMCFLHLSFPSPVLKAGFLSVSYCLSSTKIKQGTVCSLSAGTITRSWNTLLGHHFLLFRQKFMESLKSSLLGKLIAGFFFNWRLRIYFQLHTWIQKTKYWLKTNTTLYIFHGVKFHVYIFNVYNNVYNGCMAI